MKKMHRPPTWAAPVPAGVAFPARRFKDPSGDGDGPVPVHFPATDRKRTGEGFSPACANRGGRRRRPGEMAAGRRAPRAFVGQDSAERIAVVGPADGRSLRSVGPDPAGGRAPVAPSGREEVVNPGGGGSSVTAVRDNARADPPHVADVPGDGPGRRVRDRPPLPDGEPPAPGEAHGGRQAPGTRPQAPTRLKRRSPARGNRRTNGATQ